MKIDKGVENLILTYVQVDGERCGSLEELYGKLRDKGMSDEEIMSLIVENCF